MGIAWESPPEKGDKFTPVRRAPKSGSSYFLLLGDMQGCNIHYVNKTVPCQAKRHKDECPHCRAAIPRRYEGFFASMQLDEHREQVILQLPEKSSRELVEHMEPHSLIRVGRSGSHGEVWVRIISLLLPPADFPVWIKAFMAGQLPESFDVRAALLRIWRQPPELKIAEEDATISLPRRQSS